MPAITVVTVTGLWRFLAKFNSVQCKPKLLRCVEASLPIAGALRSEKMELPPGTAMGNVTSFAMTNRRGSLSPGLPKGKL
jgi:hypothetical protein